MVLSRIDSVSVTLQEGATSADLVTIASQVYSDQEVPAAYFSEHVTMPGSASNSLVSFGNISTGGFLLIKSSGPISIRVNSDVATKVLHSQLFVLALGTSSRNLQKVYLDNEGTSVVDVDILVTT